MRRSQVFVTKVDGCEVKRGLTDDGGVELVGCWVVEDVAGVEVPVGHGIGRRNNLFVVVENEAGGVDRGRS